MRKLLNVLSLCFVLVSFCSCGIFSSLAESAASDALSGSFSQQMKSQKKAQTQHNLDNY